MVTGGDAGVHGGVKFYRGSAAAARAYVEADHSPADDYYLAEGSGLATRYVATVTGEGERSIRDGGTLDGPTYERWVAGYDVDTGRPKGRLRDDDHALRFVEVVVNGPKTWSLAAAVHPEIAAAYEAAQERAAIEIVDWLAEHSTTRIGPRGRQVQVPVERLEAAVVRHYTSRAGDPHRHLHLQINARVLAQGTWRGLHSAGTVDSIEALNGIGHAAVLCDPDFRAEIAAHGYTPDPATGELEQLTPYAGPFSQRAAQIARNVDRYEVEWRSDHPGQEPGRALRRSWDRRAWTDARPDKVVPRDGSELVQAWQQELHELGFLPPAGPIPLEARKTGSLQREAAVDVILSRLGARRSAWNTADIRGEAEKLIATLDVIAQHPARIELAEDLTSRTVAACRPLLSRDDVPEHIRALTSDAVLAVEAELNDRLATRGGSLVEPAQWIRGAEHLDRSQCRVVAALAGDAELLVIEGAAGSGKTTVLATAREALEASDRRLVVVTPTLKAAQAARQQIGKGDPSTAFSAAWLVHQHGYRWDDDGHWSLTKTPRQQIDALARLTPGDVLLVDEAGMLDQDTARALLTIADQAHATVALLGDRHQLPAVGRGGVLDLAARWAPPDAHLELTSVHRFTDPTYADLSLAIRTGENPGDVFDQLLQRGDIAVHATEVERTAALAEIAATGDALVLADTRDHVAQLNAAIRDRRTKPVNGPDAARVTRRGERIGPGDVVATRRNDRELCVANRDTWTVSGISDDGSLLVTGDAGDRRLPRAYVEEHLELAYATTVHGAQGNTVEAAHLAISDHTGAAAAYVGMTRGRRHNTAHLVAESTEAARADWIATFSRDRADLGPAHATELAAEDLERHGPLAPSEADSRPIERLRVASRKLPRSGPPPQRVGVGR